MNFIIELEKAVRNDIILYQMKSLSEIYTEIELHQKDWTAASPFRCPPGYGVCCEGFEPDILEIEALYLAAYLYVHKRGLPDPVDTGCPLRSPGPEGHCTVYEARPLICRLFGLSGDRDKRGRLRYAPCRHMAGRLPGTRVYTEEEMLELFRALPPGMPDFAHRVECISPHAGEKRGQLHEILPRTLMKLHYYALLSQSPPEPPDMDIEPTPPVNRAV